MDLKLPERQNKRTVIKTLQKDFKASNGSAVRSTPCSGLAVHGTVCSCECFQRDYSEKLTAYQHYIISMFWKYDYISGQTGNVDKIPVFSYDDQH